MEGKRLQRDRGGPSGQNEVERIHGEEGPHIVPKYRESEMIREDLDRKFMTPTFRLVFVCACGLD